MLHAIVSILFLREVAFPFFLWGSSDFRRVRRGGKVRRVGQRRIDASPELRGKERRGLMVHSLSTPFVTISVQLSQFQHVNKDSGVEHDPFTKESMSKKN